MWPNPQKAAHLVKKTSIFLQCDAFVPLTDQNVCGHKIFQGGDMLQGVLKGVVLWGHVTNKINISTCRRCINTTLCKVLN